MKKRTLINSRAVAAALALTILVGGGKAARAEDVFGGTGVIIKRVFVRTAGRILSPAGGGRSRSRVNSQINRLTKDAVTLAEDAIELGNAQREMTPPRYAQAETAYRLAAKLNPKDAKPHAFLGDILFEQQRFKEAETVLRRALTIDPKDVVSYARLSYVFSKLGRFDEADETARRLQALKPNEFYGYCTLGWSQFRRQNYAEAAAAYRRAIELSPQTPGLYSDLGLILLSQRRADEAADYFRRALALDGGNPRALVNYGVALQQLGRLDQAAESYLRAAEFAPNATQPRSNLAVVNYTKGDAAGARRYWEESIRNKSAYALDRAGLLVLDRKFAEARPQLESYTRTNASDADGWLMLGDVLRALGEEPGAVAAYSKAAELAPAYARLPRPTLRAQAGPAAPQVKSETTPLMGAAARGRVADVRALLAAGADVNTQDKDGRTALMFAAAAGHADTVKVLLGKGADPNLKDETGQTAAALAQRNGREEVVRVLKRAGANQ